MFLSGLLCGTGRSMLHVPSSVGNTIDCALEGGAAQAPTSTADSMTIISTPLFISPAVDRLAAHPVPQVARSLLAPRGDETTSRNPDQDPGIGQRLGGWASRAHFRATPIATPAMWKECSQHCCTCAM
jgi:hypothetical protein